MTTLFDASRAMHMALTFIAKANATESSAIRHLREREYEAALDKVREARRAAIDLVDALDAAERGLEPFAIEQADARIERIVVDLRGVIERPRPALRLVENV